MRQKLLAFLLIIISLLVITACGNNDDGAASGKWVGEVFASANSKSSTEVGEFGSYDECVAETQKQAKSGIFNCGIK